MVLIRDNTFQLKFSVIFHLPLMSLSNLILGIRRHQKYGKFEILTWSKLIETIVQRAKARWYIMAVLICHQKGVVVRCHDDMFRSSLISLSSS